MLPRAVIAGVLGRGGRVVAAVRGVVVHRRGMVMLFMLILVRGVIGGCFLGRRGALLVIVIVILSIILMPEHYAPLKCFDA